MNLPDEFEPYLADQMKDPKFRHAYRMAEIDAVMRTNIAVAAHFCRSRSSDGNIETMQLCDAIKGMAVALVGAEEFERWERWVAPRHTVMVRAFEGGEPG